MVGGYIQATFAAGKARLIAHLIVIHDVRIVTVRKQRLAAVQVNTALSHALRVECVHHLVVALLTELVTHADFRDKLGFIAGTRWRNPIICRTKFRLVTKIALVEKVTTRTIEPVGSVGFALEITPAERQVPAVVDMPGCLSEYRFLIPVPDLS